MTKQRKTERKHFSERKKERGGQKGKDKPKPKIVVKASAIKKKNGSSSKPKVVVKAKPLDPVMMWSHNTNKVGD